MFQLRIIGTVLVYSGWLFCLMGVFALNSYLYTKTAPYATSCNSISIVVSKVDITRCDAQVIVNAANRSLPHMPGGIAGAIWRAAGAQQLNDYIDQKIRAQIIGEPVLAIAQAVHTPSFNLIRNGIKGIIHVPAPDARAGEDVQLLKNCYLNALSLAIEHGYSSIAFPALGIGIFGCPLEQAAYVTIQAVHEFCMRNNNTSLKTIYLVINPDPHDRNAQKYKQLLINKLSQ